MGAHVFWGDDMKFVRLLAPVAALFAAGCVNPVEVVQPISASLGKEVMVSDVDVEMSQLARDAMVKFEDKAREKRVAAGLPAVEAGADLASRPGRDEYATLPFANMLELVVQDITRDRGFVSGRPIKLAVEIDTLKTANAGMAILAGSSDQLAGSVKVLDPQNGEKLGEFYVDVINSHSGLLGMAMRGGGIREELAEEFAIHISRQLAGGKGKSR
jgi:hypothetical protein